MYIMGVYYKIAAGEHPVQKVCNNLRLTAQHAIVKAKVRDTEWQPLTFESSSLNRSMYTMTSSSVVSCFATVALHCSLKLLWHFSGFLKVFLCFPWVFLLFP